MLRRTSGLLDPSARAEAASAGGGLAADGCVGAGDAAAVEGPGVAPGVEFSASGRGFLGLNLGLKLRWFFNMEDILNCVCENQG